MSKKLISVFTVFAMFLVVVQGVSAQEQAEVNTSETTVEEVVENEEQVQEEFVLDDATFEVKDTEILNVEEIFETQSEQAVEKTARAAVVFPATIESIFPDPQLAQAVAEKMGFKTTDTVRHLSYSVYQVLDLSNKNITDLTGLEALLSVRELNLSRNSITDISNVDFSQLSNLTTLNLGYNRINTLEGVNWGGNNLSSLTLSNNPISELKTADWSTAPNLEYLAFYRCNLLTPESDWSSLTKLRELNFTENKISDLTTMDWHGLEPLETLLLQGNNLTSIAGVNWDGLDSLTTLNLTNNFITDLQNTDFSGLKAISNVNISSQLGGMGSLPYYSTVVLNNIVVDQFGNKVPAINISNDGTYDETTGQVSWTLPTPVSRLSYQWNYETTITGKVVTHAGTINAFPVKQYKVTFVGMNGEVLLEEIKTPYEQLTAPEVPTIAGYTFTGWTPVMDGFMPVQDVTYTATYSANADTVYKVEHYQEQLDGTYELFETDNLQGTAGDLVRATTKYYTGFRNIPNQQVSVVTGTIQDDGSLILKVYYERSQHSITFQDYDGTILLVISGKYGESITPPVTPPRDSYVFSHWTEVMTELRNGNNQRAVNITVPAYNVTYVANYTPFSVTPVPTSKPTPYVVDDGGPFTTDACGTITDRWGNVMYKPSTCQITTGYVVPNTGVK